MDRIWHAGRLHKLKSYGISGLIFGLISSFLGNMQFWVVLDEISSQEYQVFAGVPEGSIFGSTLFLLYINDLPNNVISNIAICADDIILYLKCGQASDLRQHLQWASELESVNRNRKSALSISMLQKLKWFHFASLVRLVLSL